MSGRKSQPTEADSAIFTADNSAKINPSVDLKDMPEESKVEWLKRRNKEDQKHRAGQRIKEEWFELVAGKKLIKKFRKNNGGVYSIYICNIKKPKNAGVMALLVKGPDGKYHQKESVK